MTTKTYTTLIDVDALEGLRAQRQTIIIDCRFSLSDPARGLAHWHAGRIPGARYAHLDNDLSGQLVAGRTGRHPLPERAALARRFREWGINGDSWLICHDDNTGAFASRFWWLSHWLGHTACAVLDGGLDAWKAAGLPIDRQPPTSNVEGNFAASEASVDVIDGDTVANGKHVLIDARDAPRFRGEVEPIDPVAGHIDGAVNLPFQANLDADGRWLPRADLQARFRPLLSEAAGRPIAHYCGSGVTAAHNVLAMTHAGLPAGALYAGSWSEWITRDAAAQP